MMRLFFSSILLFTVTGAVSLADDVAAPDTASAADDIVINRTSFMHGHAGYFGAANVDLVTTPIQPRRLPSIPNVISLLPPYNFDAQSTINIRLNDNLFVTDYSCPYGSTLDENSIRMLTQLSGRCDDLARQKPFDPTKSYREQLPEIQNICRCYNGGDSLQSASVPPSRSRPSIFKLARDRRVRIPEVANSNLDAERSYLQDLVESTQVQASLLSHDGPEAQSMSVAFHQNYLREGGSPEAARDLRKAQRNVERAFADAELGRPEEPLIINNNPELLTGVATGSCVSRRDFAAFRQYPSDPLFYSDMASINQYNENQWDFEKLTGELRSITNSEGILSLANARAHRRAGPLIRRLEFLQKNPLLKNILASNLTRREKLPVFEAIRANFTSGQDQSIRNGETFRRRIMEFLNNPNPKVKNHLNEEVREESRREYSRRLANVHERVTQTHQLATGTDLLALTPTYLESFGSYSGTTGGTFYNDSSNPSLGQLGTNEQVVSSNLRLNGDYFRARRLQAVSRVCPMVLEGNFDTSFVVNELERQWATEAGTSPNPDFTGQTFGDFSMAVCQNRKNSAGETMNYDTWIQNKCGSDSVCRDDRKLRLQEFLTEYPSSDFPGDPAPAFLSVLRNVPYADFTDAAANIAASVGARSYADGLRTGQSAYNGQYVIANGTRGGAPAGSYRRTMAGLERFDQSSSPGASRTMASTIPTSSSTAQTSPASAQMNPGQLPPGGVGSPEGTVFQPQQRGNAEAQPEVVRQQLNRSNAELQSVRDEISAIGKSLQRETAKEPSQRNDELIAGFNRQLDQLNSRLDSAVRENRQLQEQLALAESRNRSRSQSRSENDFEDPAPRAASFERNQSSSAAAVNAPVQSNQQVQNGGTNTANNPSPSASLAGNNAGVRRVPNSGSVNGAILSGQLARGNTGESSAAITIGNASSSDYLQLLSQTAGNEISESLPSDVFSQIQNGDPSALERFRERVRALPGNVVRLDLREEGSTEKIELLIVKNGEQLSVATRNGRAIASEGGPEPVPEAPVQRNATLEDLNNTVRTPQ